LGQLAQLGGMIFVLEDFVFMPSFVTKKWLIPSLKLNQISIFFLFYCVDGSRIIHNILEQGKSDPLV
jgi:hypothetical protein